MEYTLEFLFCEGKWTEIYLGCYSDFLYQTRWDIANPVTYYDIAHTFSYYDQQNRICKKKLYQVLLKSHNGVSQITTYLSFICYHMSTSSIINWPGQSLPTNRICQVRPSKVSNSRTAVDFSLDALEPIFYLYELRFLLNSRSQGFQDKL